MLKKENNNVKWLTVNVLISPDSAFQTHMQLQYWSFSLHLLTTFAFLLGIGRWWPACQFLSCWNQEPYRNCLMDGYWALAVVVVATTKRTLSLWLFLILLEKYPFINIERKYLRMENYLIILIILLLYHPFLFLTKFTENLHNRVLPLEHSHWRGYGSL